MLEAACGPSACASDDADGMGSSDTRSVRGPASQSDFGQRRNGGAFLPRVAALAEGDVTMDGDARGARNDPLGELLTAMRARGAHRR